jgi:hypothetical protein
MVRRELGLSAPPHLVDEAIRQKREDGRFKTAESKESKESKKEFQSQRSCSGWEGVAMAQPQLSPSLVAHSTPRTQSQRIIAACNRVARALLYIPDVGEAARVRRLVGRQTTVPHTCEGQKRTPKNMSIQTPSPREP